MSTVQRCETGHHKSSLRGACPSLTPCCPLATLGRWRWRWWLRRRDCGLLRRVARCSFYLSRVSAVTPCDSHLPAHLSNRRSPSSYTAGTTATPPPPPLSATAKLLSSETKYTVSTPTMLALALHKNYTPLSHLSHHS